MRQDYFERIPDPLQKVVREIEVFAGLEIEIHPKTEAIDQRFPEQRGQVSGWISEQQAAILYPASGLPLQSIAHEVFHFERFWLQMVPQFRCLSATDNFLQVLARQLDNFYEHQFVLKKQRAFNLLDLNRWTNEVLLAAERAWDSRSRIISVVTGALTARHALENNELCLEIISEASHLPEASRIENACAAFSRDFPDRAKDKCIQILLAAAEVSAADFEWVRLDVRSRRSQNYNFGEYPN
jgi:hypothetical protein